MAVPSAVRRQRERLEAELGVADPNAVAPPADPTLTLVPPVAENLAPPQVEVTPPAPAEDAAAKARIAELEQLLRTRDGQASTSARESKEARERAELLASQVTSLEEAVAELVKQKDTAESMATARRADADMPALDDLADLSPAELEQFGTDSVEFVKKLSKRELVAFIKPLVAKVDAIQKQMARLSDLDKLPHLEKAVTASQAETQRNKDEEFFRKEVLHYFPDFEAVREKPEWIEYMNSDIAGRGIQVKHHLQAARLQHNAHGIRAILQAFYDTQGAKPSLASLAVPNKTQTEGSPVVKPRLKASEYNATLKKFTSKLIPKAEWDSFKTAFLKAYDEGRVEMDARL